MNNLLRLKQIPLTQIKSGSAARLSRLAVGIVTGLSLVLLSTASLSLAASADPIPSSSNSTLTINPEDSPGTSPTSVQANESCGSVCDSSFSSDDETAVTAVSSEASICPNQPSASSLLNDALAAAPSDGLIGPEANQHGCKISQHQSATSLSCETNRGLDDINEVPNDANLAITPVCTGSSTSSQTASVIDLVSPTTLDTQQSVPTEAPATNRASDEPATSYVETPDNIVSAGPANNPAISQVAVLTNNLVRDPVILSGGRGAGAGNENGGRSYGRSDEQGVSGSTLSDHTFLPLLNSIKFRLSAVLYKFISLAWHYLLPLELLVFALGPGYAYSKAGTNQTSGGPPY